MVVTAPLLAVPYFIFEVRPYLWEKVPVFSQVFVEGSIRPESVPGSEKLLQLLRWFSFWKSNMDQHAVRTGKYLFSALRFYFAFLSMFWHFNDRKIKQTACTRFSNYRLLSGCSYIARSEDYVLLDNETRIQLLWHYFKISSSINFVFRLV